MTGDLDTEQQEEKAAAKAHQRALRAAAAAEALYILSVRAA